MAGERSKSSGEYGERIVSSLLDMIGWTNRNGVDFPCVLKDAHRNKNGNPRVTHGVDYVVRYNDPLFQQQETNILVSVKHRANYPNGQSGRTSKFKEYLKDIAEAAECFPSYKSQLSRISGTKAQDTICAIFWISAEVNDLETSIIADIESFRNTEAINYNTVYLLDNAKALFLYSSICYAKNCSDKFSFLLP